jgi:hypothetical protein
MKQEQLIDKIYKKLEYACFLHLGNDTNTIVNTLQLRKWECLLVNIQPDELLTTFDCKYPTIFHYTWIESLYNIALIDYIKISTDRPGWQKRFILMGFESLNEEENIKLTKLHYTRISMAGNFYIHDFYRHYLHRI